MGLMSPKRPIKPNSTFAGMLNICKTNPHRGLIGVASHFNGWYQMAMKMRAFRYATSNAYRVPTARHPLTITLPAIEMAGRSALATLDTSRTII